jgi:hypothetical protein
MLRTVTKNNDDPGRVAARRRPLGGKTAALLRFDKYVRPQVTRFCARREGMGRDDAGAARGSPALRDTTDPGRSRKIRLTRRVWYPIEHLFLH